MCCIGCAGVRLRCPATESAFECHESKASEPANIASASLAIGWHTAASEIAFTPTATHAARLPFFRCGTSGCRNSQTVRDSRRCARKWSDTSSPAIAEEASGEVPHLDVHIASSPFHLKLPLPTSKGTRRVRRRAGVGSKTGVGSTALSSKIGVLIIISARNKQKRE